MKTNALIRNADREKNVFDTNLAAVIGAEYRAPALPNARGVIGQGSYFPGIHQSPNWKEYFE